MRTSLSSCHLLDGSSPPNHPAVTVKITYEEASIAPDAQIVPGTPGIVESDDKCVRPGCRCVEREAVRVTWEIDAALGRLCDIIPPEGRGRGVVVGWLGGRGNCHGYRRTDKRKRDQYGFDQ